MSTIRDVLAKKGTHVATISPDATALEAANVMKKHHYGSLCIVKDDALVGVFTERDLLNKVVSARLDAASTKVGDVMTTSVITCGPNGKNDDCVAVMSHKRVRHLPVLENGKLIGMVSTGDLLARQVEEKQAFIEDLYEYLHGRT